MMLDEESSIQKHYLLLTQERDTLKSEQEELKVYFDELKGKCCALTDHLNTIKEKCDALQRDKDKLIGLEGTLKMMLDKDSSIRKSYLLLMQGKNTLRSEHEQLKVSFGKLKRECNDLKENVNAIIEEHVALLKDKKELVRLKATLNDVKRSIQYSEGSLDIPSTSVG
jgi:chromosome segregation ATPase